MIELTREEKAYLLLALRSAVLLEESMIDAHSTMLENDPDRIETERNCKESIARYTRLQRKLEQES